MEVNQVYYDYSCLPPHILVDIIWRLNLTDLKNAMLTCKSWYWASSDQKITKHILVNGLTDSSCIDYLQRPIQNIRLSAVNLNKFNFRKLLTAFGQTIKELDILLPKLAITRIFEIFIYLPNVETVQIQVGTHYYSAKNFTSFKRIAKYRDRIAENLKQIKFLTIHTRLHHLEPMQLFLSQCTNVQKLVWNEWIYLPNDQTAFLCDFLLDPERNPMIFNLNGLLIGSINSYSSSEILKKLINLPLPNLKRLQLKEISKSNYNTVFREFCKVYHFLDEFTINGCNDQQLFDICRYMPNLKSLALDNCNALDFTPIANLAQIESLHLDRVGELRDDHLIVLLSLKLKKLTKLSLNMINENVLKFICENYSHLEQLILEGVDTKDCEPIFRNLTKLKVLNLAFMEHATCHSSRLQSSDEYNITRLNKLQQFYVSCWVPGITPTLIQKLPNLNYACQDICLVYDPTEEEFAEWALAAQERNHRAHNENMQTVASDGQMQEYDVTDFNINLYNDFL